jgi:hypothetical protein
MLQEPAFERPRSLNDIFAILQKALPVTYPHIGKSTLPDLYLISAFAPGQRAEK